MLYRFVLLLFISFTCYLFSFADQPADSIEVIATQSNSNLLYAGIDNPIKIPGYSPSDIDVSSSNGKIYETDTGFILIPSQHGKNKLTIKNKNSPDAGEKQVEMDVIRFPQPDLYIGDERIGADREINKRKLLGADSIHVFFTDDIKNIEEWFEIRGFNLGYHYGGHYLSFDNDGNTFTDKTKRSLISLKPGQDIIIRIQLISKMNISVSRPLYRIKVTL